MVPTRSLPALDRSTPEAHGIPSGAVLAFVDAAEQQGRELHSLMMLRHGQVVAEAWWSPYRAGVPHMLFSLTKSFTSTAVGLAVAEGRLAVDDPVLSFFPERAPAQVSEHLAALRVRHLLTMTTGHQEDPTHLLFEPAHADWVRGILEQPLEYAPGSHFVYNSAASYLLSAIVQQRTGERVADYLRPRLFEPLGIEETPWEVSPQGINTGGWGLSLRTEDIARFGQLYLQKGTWDRERQHRILPESWVVAATARQVSNDRDAEPDWRQGYGYQFWRCRHGAYRGDGAMGQFCIVMPAQDAVLALTAGVGNMQGVLDLVWEHLLPAMGPAALPEDREAQARLGDRLASLALPLPEGQATSPVAGQVSGSRYHFPANDQKVEAMSLDFTSEGCVLSVLNERGEHHIDCGHGAWAYGTTTLETAEPRRVAGAGAWTAEDTYVARLCMNDTPFVYTYTCRFAGDEVTVAVKANVAFGPVHDRPTLVGKRTAQSGE